MNTKQLRQALASLAVIGACGWTTGCDRAETDTALAVDPARSTISGTGATVFLTAFDPDQGVYTYSPEPSEYRAAKASWDSEASQTNALNSQLILPLKWQVSNPSLGRIARSAGYSAVYESFGGRGQNYVTVEDQVGREGIAVVNHRWESELDQENEPE